MISDSEFAARLPARLPIESLHECQRRAKSDLGGDFLIFKRVSYAEHSFVGYPGFDDDTAPRSWAAQCRCTVCRETSYLGWHSEPDNAPHGIKRIRGVIVSELDDGLCLSGVPASDGLIFREGDTIRCPNCQRDTTLKHYDFFLAANDSKQRTWRVMWMTVHNLDTFTTLVYWLITRTVSGDASVSVKVEPRHAVVVDTKKLRYFRFAKVWNTDNQRWDDTWKSCKPLDPEQRFYKSQSGGRKVGALHSTDIPDFAGMSAEKTGLMDYLLQDGAFPVLYLKFWQRFPNIENLVKVGWSYTIDSAIGTDVRKALIGGLNISFPRCLKIGIRWQESSPAKMLSMTRQEVHENAPLQWDFAQLGRWLEFVYAGLAKPGDTYSFTVNYQFFGGSNLGDWLRLQRQRGDVPLDKVKRYLRKQRDRHDIPQDIGLRLFVDYRTMLQRIDTATGRQSAGVELWPQNLRTAHDNASTQVAALKEDINAMEFVKLREKWADLEVSDGEICARLPTSQLDLVVEGRTLCHCVGSYGREHLSGRLIVFIRHARRPERPWFTLNVDTTGYEPRRIQLHGYGNEFAHGKKLHIPQAVRDFCAKWEKDVLLPVFAKVNAK